MSLSDEMIMGCDVDGAQKFLWKYDVKEFIRKERVIIQGLVNCIKKEKPCFNWNGFEELDELAGPELTNGLRRKEILRNEK